jgi:thymidylate synthase (FAD)
MIEILNYTQNPLSHIGRIAGICWNSDVSTSEKNKKRAINCINNEHGRVMEYVDIEIVISEYSARMIRELYTSIIGVSRLQESTRYVDCTKFDYYIPDTILNNIDALKEYHRTMNNIKIGYENLLKLGIAKEDIANVLPLGMYTKIVLKINLRALDTLFETRTCTRAYKEYRLFMQELKSKLSRLGDEWKYICDNVLKTKCDKSGVCSEKFSCHRHPQVNN